jgi:hypothetical protein
MNELDANYVYYERYVSYGYELTIRSATRMGPIRCFSDLTAAG